MEMDVDPSRLVGGATQLHYSWQFSLYQLGFNEIKGLFCLYVNVAAADWAHPPYLDGSKGRVSLSCYPRLTFIMLLNHSIGTILQMLNFCMLMAVSIIWRPSPRSAMLAYSKQVSL